MIIHIPSYPYYSWSLLFISPWNPNDFPCDFSGFYPTSSPIDHPIWVTATWWSNVPVVFGATLAFFLQSNDGTCPNPQWVRWCSYQNTIYIMLYLHSWILSWFKSIDIHLYHNLSLFLVDFWPCKHRLHATFRRRAPSAVPWSSGAGSIGSTWWEIWIEPAGPGKKKQGFDVIIFSGFNWLIYGLYMVNIWLIYGEWGLIIIWLVVEPPL